VSDSRQALFNEYISLLAENTPFTFLKVNHGFWDKLREVDSIDSWPTSLEEAKQFAKTLKINTNMFSEFNNELMHLFDFHRRGLSGVDIFASVTAHPPTGNSPEKNKNGYLIEKYLNQQSNPDISTFMKHVSETGQIIDLLEVICKKRVVVVAPYIVTQNLLLDKFENISYVEISYNSAQINRWKIFAEIEEQLEGFNNPILLIQAGTLSIYWGVLLKYRFPNLTILDMGLALGVAAPDSLLAIRGAWVSNRSFPIFESARRIGAAFSSRDEIDVEYYSRLSNLSFEIRQLEFLGTKIPDLASRVKDLEGKLVRFDDPDQNAHGSYSSVKYWLSEAYLKVGDARKSFDLLEESLRFPLMGFHLPHISMIKHYIKENDYAAALDIYEKCRSIYPRELHFVDFGERQGRLAKIPELVNAAEKWRKDLLQEHGNFIFADLPFWKSENELSTDEILTRIQNHVTAK
jgi:tetratricopeptide (TPR) repeat protein